MKTGCFGMVDTSQSPALRFMEIVNAGNGTTLLPVMWPLVPLFILILILAVTRLLMTH